MGRAIHWRTPRAIAALAMASATMANADDLRALTDQQVSDYAATRLDLKRLPHYHEVIGTLRGVPVEADLFCSDVCPDYTVRVVHLAPAPGQTCEAAGGVETAVRVPYGIGSMERDFCLPKVLAEKR